MEKGREENEDWWGKIEQWERETQRAKRWERIRSSGHNRWYWMVKGVGIPEYLKKGWGESRWKRVLRFRMGNEMKESRYWEEEKKRSCRLCGGERET